MTIDDVRAAIAEIDRQAYNEGDDERAHAREDALHQAVLAAIAEGAENAQELARLALKTKEIVFSRWYA